MRYRWIASLVLFTVVTRLPTLLLPQPIDDEAIYSVVANEIVHGGRPYIDAIERKPPLLFWTYAGIFKLTGEFNWVALHVVELGWVLLTMAGLYVLAQALFADVAAGLIAALLYSLYQPWGLWKNLAFDGEVLMLLPVVWAYAIALGPPRSRFRFEALLAGALICAGFLLKQPAAIAAVPLGLYFLLPSYRSTHRLTVGGALVHAALFTVGFFASLGGVALWLRHQGILAEAYFWTVTHHAPAHFFWNRAAENTAGFVVAAVPLLVAATIGMRSNPGWTTKPAERFAIVGWLVVSAIGIAAGERFYPHYYIQALPPLALLAAPVFARLWRGVDSGTPRWFSRALSQRWLGLTAVVFLIVNTTGLLMNQAGTAAGAYLRQHAPPDARMFVWGQGTRIYVDARLRPASRYVATFPLTGYMFGPDTGVDTSDRIVPGAWDNFEKDLQARPPAFFVDGEVGDDRRNPITQFPVILDLLEHYRIVATTPDGTVYQRIDERGTP